MTSIPSKPLPRAARPDWSIAEVERETGLGKDTLRVWERRYGFPQPRRDASGDRLYPADQVSRLRRIKRLLDLGWRPGKVVPLSPKALQALLDTRTREQAPGTESGGTPLVPLGPWLQWLAQDRTELIKSALQQAILKNGLGATVEWTVAPLCAMVGEAWVRGDLSIYQEHLFTEIVQSVLREAIASVDAAAQAHLEPRVLLTTSPTEQHGLGLLMAECFFAQESCSRYGLGVSTPLDDMVQAVQQLQIDVLALSFSAHASRREMVDSLTHLRQRLPDRVALWVGGAGASVHARHVPPGVLLMQRAEDVVSHIHAWRQAHPARAAVRRA